jgi:hypothetical protein
MWLIHLYFNTSLTCSSLGRKCEIGVYYILFYFINKLCMLGFKIETFGSDSMLNYYVTTSSPKELN